MTFVTGYISPLCQCDCLLVDGNVQGLQGLGRINQVWSWPQGPEGKPDQNMD